MLFFTTGVTIRVSEISAGLRIEGLRVDGLGV